MEDRSIIALYNERNERAIDESANKYGPHCYSIAYNILCDTQDSEECLNDTWLKAWNSIPPTVPNSLKLFLSRIVRNLSFDKYRSKHREKRGGAEIALALDELSEVASAAPSIEDELAEKELQTLISNYLRRLPTRERNVFLRRYYYVDPVSVIAKRFSISESNVFTILSRTRSKLKDLLQKEGYKI